MGDVRDQSAAFAEAPITPQSAPDLERKAHALVDITSTIHRRPVNDITMNSPLKETPQMGHLQQTLGLLQAIKPEAAAQRAKVKFSKVQDKRETFEMSKF